MVSQMCEQRELMKLFKCVIDVGNEVLSAYFDLKVLSLPKYGGNFTQFLEDEKHFLYHQWEQKRTMCCACKNVGCSITRIKKMKTWIFEKLYEANGIENPAHVIKRGGCIQQLCLHKFVTRKIAAHELDITVLNFFLQVFAHTRMSAAEKLSLQTVCQCRDSICHSWSPKCFSMAELNKKWKDLETHLVNLSEIRYQRIVRNRIQDFRKIEIDREEIAELTNHINYLREIVDDVNHNLQDTRNKVVSALVEQFEKNEKSSNQIQKSVTDQSLALKQGQEEVISVVKNERRDLENKIMTKMSQLENAQEELIQMFGKTVFVVKYDKPVRENSTEEMVKECAVLWHIKTPSNWNEKEVAEALKDIEKLAEKLDIKIKFVRYGSLIILTTVPYGILHNKVKYEHAIEMFLTRMVDVCNINTEMACRVKVSLHLLKLDEVNIQHSYVLCEDKSTQTFQMSVPQADKCFQINSYECAGLIDQEDMKLNSRSLFKLNSRIDNLESGLCPVHDQRSSDNSSFHNPSTSSGVIPNVTYPDSSPHIPLCEKESGLGIRSLRRANSTSAYSIRSGDSSYGSSASMAGSIGGWNNQYHEINTPSTATADTIYKSSSFANLQGKSFEHTSEFKTSLQEQATSSSASALHLPSQWKGSTPELKSLGVPTTLSFDSPYLPQKWKEPEFEESVEEIKPMPIDAEEIIRSSETKKRSKKCSIQ